MVTRLQTVTSLSSEHADQHFFLRTRISGCLDTVDIEHDINVYQRVVLNKLKFSINKFACTFVRVWDEANAYAVHPCGHMLWLMPVHVPNHPLP